MSATDPPPSNRFPKFTERARKVLSLAQEESQHFGTTILAPNTCCLV